MRKFDSLSIFIFILISLPFLLSPTNFYCLTENVAYNLIISEWKIAKPLLIHVPTIDLNRCVFFHLKKK